MKEISKLSLDACADLSYLNNSKDAMDVKLLKYFENMPKQFIVANLLDPRQKTTIARLQDEKMPNRSASTSTRKNTSSIRSFDTNKSNELISIETITEIYETYYNSKDDESDEEITQTQQSSSNTKGLFPQLPVKSLFESQLARAIENHPSPTGPVAKV